MTKVRKEMDRHPSRPEYVRVCAYAMAEYSRREFEKETDNHGWACFDCFERDRRLAEDPSLGYKQCEDTCGGSFVWARYETAVLLKLEGSHEP